MIEFLFHPVFHTTVQDCRISPSPCDVNAKCVNTKRKTKGQYGGYAYRCACNYGYVGNGLQCANEKTGKAQLTVRCYLFFHVKNYYYEIHNQFNNYFLSIGKLDLPSEGLQIELTLNLAPQIKIERTEKNFPIGKATTDFESQLKRMQAANDGKEVFCNGNSGRKYSWNETAY